MRDGNGAPAAVFRQVLSELALEDRLRFGLPDRESVRLRVDHDFFFDRLVQRRRRLFGDFDRRARFFLK